MVSNEYILRYVSVHCHILPSSVTTTRKALTECGVEEKENK
jgi:hypothetical protein